MQYNPDQQMIKCTQSERAIIEALHYTQIWSNAVYVVGAVFALIGRRWILGIGGFIVAIVSCLHHQFNYIDARCVKEGRHKKFFVLEKADVYLANIVSIYGLYLVYAKKQPLSWIFVVLFLTFVGFGLVTFIISSYYFSPRALKKDVNTQDYIKYAALYEHYHGYWHIFSGICFVLVVLWLTLERIKPN